MRRSTSIQARPGFTFVELMVATAVMMVLGGMTMVLGQTGRAAWMTVGTRMGILSDTQRAITRLSTDLRNASAASVNCPGPGVLQLTRVDGEAVQYTQNAAGLLRASNGGAPVIVASRITDFDIPTCLGGVVKFQLSTNQDVHFYQSMQATSTWDIAHRVESQVWLQNP